MFQGFSQETIQFLWGIRFNNERTWFNAHKQDYLQHLYEPLKELAADVQERMAARYPDAQLNIKVTRIYRDARRLHGRGPYKEQLWFVLREPVEPETPAPTFYFEISPDGYAYGLSYYCPRPSFMEKYRHKILREPEKLEKLARRLKGRPDIVLEGTEYKRSKGAVSDALKPWFNRKWVELNVCRPFDDRYDRPELVDDMVDTFCFLMPYYQYFMEVGLEHIPEA